MLEVEDLETVHLPIIDKNKKVFKKKNNNHYKRKAGTHYRGKEDEKRKTEWKEEYNLVCENLANIGDPFDNMSLEDKKVHGISLFYQLMKVFF